MPTLVHDATVVNPADGQVRVLANWSLVFEGGRITELAPADHFTARITRGDFADVVLASRHILMPGLVNTHHHLYQSLTRCLPAAQNVQLFHWLLQLYERWRGVDFKAINLAAKISIAELLLHGCTTTSDHFYLLPPHSNVRMEAVLEAASELGIRLHLCRGSMTLGQSGGGLPPDDCTERDADVLTDCQRVLDAYHDARPYALRRIDLAPCSPFNVTPELLRETRVLARERGVLLHTHLAETLDEDRFCLEKFGKRPAEYLADLDWLGPDVYLAHCVHLNAAEIELFARTKTGISLCPVSNLRLGSGLPPLRRLLAAGVPVGLGVDGASSNDGGNMLATVKQALLVSRLPDGAPGPGTFAAAPPDTGAAAGTPHASAETLTSVAEIFKLATVGGAAVLNRSELGHVSPGAAADFALFRVDDPALAGAAAQDPLAALVLCDAPRAARVWVAGREVVREGRIVALDETTLGAEFNDLVAARFR